METNKNSDSKLLEQLGYVMLLLALRHTSFCPSCSQKLFKEAYTVSNEIGDDIIIDSGLLKYGFIPMDRWSAQAYVDMVNALISVKNRFCFCDGCKLLLDEELSNLQNSTENENKKGIENG